MTTDEQANLQPAVTHHRKSGDHAAPTSKVLLVVNVASECGLTKQYEGLEALYETYRDRGWKFWGSRPMNSARAGQQRRDPAFCRGTFGVQFPMFAKIEVNGEHRHPLYRALIAAQPDAVAPEGSEFARMTSKGRAPKHAGDILWNFEKFLVARDGTVIQRFA